MTKMKSSRRPTLFVFCLHCGIASIGWAVNPACECVVLKKSPGRNYGTFTSPNYPHIYAANVNCILYTFIGSPGEIIEITFLEFDMQVPVTNRCTDFLRLFLDLERPEVNEHNQWTYELCGNISMITKRHYSSTPNIIIELHTDSYQGNHTGFRGIYKFLDKSQFEIVGGSKRWGSTCSFGFNSNRDVQSGRFFSPSYPQDYPPSSKCQYIFYGRRNEKVIVNFQNIQLEFIDGSCSDSPDYIEVRDGPDPGAPVIARFCNTLNGEQVFSTAETLFVEFVSDSRKQRQGFAATYRFISEEEQKLSIGSLDGAQQQASQTALNTQNVGDSPREVVFDHRLPATTDADDSKKTISSGCDHNFPSYQQKQGTFSSPFYPNPYPSDIRCRYTFQGQGSERVQIIFIEFDLQPNSMNEESDAGCEDSDSVTVSVSIGGSAKELGVFCSRKRPPMLMSPNTQMEATFTSRTVNPGRGFIANYSFVTDYGIKSGQRNSSMACGFVFWSNVSTNGTFTSPNFPGYYPRNTECHYLFYGSESDCIYITFPYFDVEGISPCVEDTLSDFVEFSNFNIELMDRKMSRYCGSKQDHAKRAVSSDGNFFRVTFKSNDVFDATGFEAFYQFRKVEDPYSSKPKSTASSSPLSATTFFVSTTWVMLMLIRGTTPGILFT